MEKYKLLEILALHYGIVPDKATTREYQEFLNIIGINTESPETLLAELEKVENEIWNALVSPVQVVKHGDIAAITVSLPDNELDKSFEWTLLEEGGKYHKGEFYASHLKILESGSIHGNNFHKIRLTLPIRLEMGYHNLKIRSETGKEGFMKLVVTPKKCYKPLALEKNTRIKGIKYSLYKENIDSDYKISDYTTLKNIINYAKTQDYGIVGVNSINYSGRMAFSPLLIDVDAAVNFVEDRDIRLKILSDDFQQALKSIQESEFVDLEAILDYKTKVFKLIYKSFRENHIAKNTPKSRDFFYYLSVKGGNLRKLALFDAIKEYLIDEDPKLAYWHDWPQDYQDPNSEAVRLFEKNNIEAVQFYEFLQWLADLQLNVAGRTSWLNRLATGIYTEWPFFTDENDAETWLKGKYYADTAFTEAGNPPLIPFKLKNEGYRYISEMLQPDMTHSGALKIRNIQGFDRLKWTSKLNPDIEFYVKYPFEDILGIIALETHRNKCAAVIDQTEDLLPEIVDLLEKYGFVRESDFDITELDAILPIQQPKTEGTDYTGRIEFERTPLSTYRLQFNKNFTFRDAQDIVPYLKDLGISHCYASPILRAREGSMHGYDIINHAELNPEIGTIQDFYDFINTLHYHDMGLIVDIVPNHMGIGKENKWWMDVLENGRASRFASYLDIDWEPLKKELKGKVLVPVLGDQYGNILISGQLKFNFNRETGRLTLNYWEHEFPINPSSYPTFLIHRVEVLESRLGSNNTDFLEYLSIINVFKKLPGINETSAEAIFERNMEKDIALRRLSELCRRNGVISGFVQENINDFQAKPNDQVSCNRMHNFLEEQAYRLAYWRVSIDVINYRRFFDINDLIGLKTENPLVFTSTHSLILDLVEQEKIDGLRLDHPDGLLDPANYFKTLQVEAGKRLGINFDPNHEQLLGSDKLPIYVLAEKILAPFEKIPKDWAIHGTVGYEFLNSLTNLLVDGRNSKKFTRIYQRFVENVPDFNELVIECKKLIMKTSLTGELSTLSNYLNRISEKYYSTRDYTLNNIREALTEIIACFPVYRTYISEEHRGDKAVDYIKWAIGLAKRRTMHTDPSIFNFIEKVLLVELEEDVESEDYRDTLKFAMKFQQYTAPLMAKGLEDTSFYRYNKLVALNEVGGEPVHFGMSVNEFHNHNIRRLERTPHGMLCTSTHDTKRSEDVRARICVLSEVPDIWYEKINRFSAINQSRKTTIDNTFAPDRNDEYLFYQTLVGIWPPDPPDESEKEALVERLENYMIKAIREAKVHTSWININTEYEDAIRGYIRKILTSPDNHPFWREFLAFQKDVAQAGFLNSLFQCVLKLTCPGVPDIYQGSEDYKFTLVDPDNRGAVDYACLKQKLDEIKSNELPPQDMDQMKLFLTWSILNFRQKHQNIFRQGQYVPLETRGLRARNLVAFARQHEDEALIAVVPRLVYNMENAWKDTLINIPEEYAGYKWTDILSGREFDPMQDCINVGRLLDGMPVALLHGINEKEVRQPSGN